MARKWEYRNNEEHLVKSVFVLLDMRIGIVDRTTHLGHLFKISKGIDVTWGLIWAGQVRERSIIASKHVANGGLRKYLEDHKILGCSKRWKCFQVWYGSSLLPNHSVAPGTSLASASEDTVQAG